LNFFSFTKKSKQKISDSIKKSIQKGLDPNVPLPFWESDKNFNQLFHPIIGHSLVDRQRFFILYEFANHAATIDGNVAEVGVYKGGTAKFLASIFSNKKIHLFDTFSGMPDTDASVDGHKKGDFDDTSLEKVEEFLKDYDDIYLYKGIFPFTAEPIKNSTFCFVHIDADIYRSCLDSCIFFYPRLSTGGIMIFDDYGWVGCPGAKKAIDEFFSNKPEHPCYLPTGQAIVIKQ